LNLVKQAQMPPKRLRNTLRHSLAALRWVLLAALVSVPLSAVPRLLVPGGPSGTVWLPGELGRSVVGIVDAVTPGELSASPKPVQRTHAPAAATASGQRQRISVSATRSAHTLVPVVSASCSSCRVLHNASTGAIRVTLGSADRTAPGSAFALLDFGGLDGASGVVHVHDLIGLDRGQVPQSDLSVLQVTDVENRVAYRLQIDRITRILRLVSPPGGLGRAGLDVSTGMQVPDDGVRTLAVDVAAQAGRSLVVQVNGKTVASRQGLSGGNAVRQRFLAVGILNTPATMTTLSVTHDALQVGVGSAAAGDQAAVTSSGLQLAPEVSQVPPSNLAPPTITGDAVAGQPLVATPGRWNDADSVRVRWSRCADDGTSCDQIANANALTYVPDTGDAGSTFLVTATAANDAGTGVAASTLTPVVANSKPVLLTAPSIAGVPVKGSTLTASPGTWSWRNGSFTYAWQRCDSAGANCATLDGATASTLTLGPDDVGSTIRVLVTAPGFTTPTSAAAPATDPVRPATPLSLAAPTVSGNAITGALLTATTGDWSDAPASYAYTWDRCSTNGACAQIPGANGSTYSVGIEDLGSTLRVTVAASNAGGTGTAASAPTAPVGPAAPSISAAPAISGDTVVGSTLTLSTGTWSDAQATLGITWQRCPADGSACVTIDGATGTTYTLTDNDAGSIIEAVVTATNAAGSASATTAGTAAITLPAPPAPTAPSITTPPAISGDTVVGSTLTLSTGTWSDAQASIGITWQRCAADGTACATIDGATGTTYTLADADAGSIIEAVVTATNAGGSATATTAGTAPVTAAPPAQPAEPLSSSPVAAGDTAASTTDPTQLSTATP
jgi:hypothetical protein